MGLKLKEGPNLFMLLKYLPHSKIIYPIEMYISNIFAQLISNIMAEDIESPIDVVELSKDNNITYDDPQEWPKKKKYFVLVVISITGMIAPLTSM